MLDWLGEYQRTSMLVGISGFSGATLLDLLDQVSKVHEAGFEEQKIQKKAFVVSKIIPWVQRTIAHVSGVFSGATSSFNKGVKSIQTQFKNEIFPIVKWECCLETIWELLKNPPELNPRIQVEAINTIKQKLFWFLGSNKARHMNKNPIPPIAKVL